MRSESLTIKVGASVTVTRDEALWPPRGSWPRWRGRTGTVVEVNRSGERRMPEYGVVFRATARRPNGSLHGCGSDSPVWFLPHELTAVP